MQFGNIANMGPEGIIQELMEKDLLILEIVS